MSARTNGLLITVALLIAAAWLAAAPLRDTSAVTGKPLRFTGPLDQVERFEQAAMTPYLLEELHTWFGRSGSVSTPTTPAEAKYTVGDQRTFQVYDDPAEPAHVVTATLAYAGPLAEMYVDDRVQVGEGALHRAAQTFETSIAPRNRAVFGEEAFPLEPVVVLHTTLAHAGGYFSPMDALTQALSGDSNPRKLLVIGVDSYAPGTQEYLSILSHEFQHMIHAHQQPGSPAWFNEGLSTLAQDMIGYPDDDLGLIYLTEPAIGLTGWAQDASRTGSHYGAANLFLRYFLAHYGEQCDATCLLREDAGNHPDVFARFASERRPGIQVFADLVADWAVANVVNDPQVGDGRYAYDELPGYATVASLDHDSAGRTVAQFGVDYLGVFEGPLTINFDGEDAVPLAGAQAVDGEWMWWSNRGDGKYATLTRAFDLSGLPTATLQFSAWYEMERNFDYGYVTVSGDAGRTWQPLPGKTTTADDPHGQNLGHGLTGVSGHAQVEAGGERRGRWVAEEMDLTPYAGQQILLRFWLINDPEFNAPGLLLDRICVPQIEFCDGAEDETGGWLAQGFVRTTGGIPQGWELRLAVRSEAGLTIKTIQIDDHNRATIPLEAGDRGVLVILGAAGHTEEPAVYQIRTS